MRWVWSGLWSFQFQNAPSGSSPHRYDDNGTLCIWYPNDPPEQKWEFEDGLLALINHIQAHLFREAWWREHDEWLGPEAPHAQRKEPAKEDDRCRLSSAATTNRSAGRTLSRPADHHHPRRRATAEVGGEPTPGARRRSQSIHRRLPVIPHASGAPLIPRRFKGPP